MRRLALAVSLVAPFAACSETLTAQSVVSDLRVVALRADPPTAAPGDSVELDALVVDPFGEDRPVTRLWAGCLNPPTDNPARCLQGGVPTMLGDGETARVEIPTDALAERERGVFGVLLYLCAGGTPVLSDTGVECDGPDSSQVLAVKRIRIEAQPDNENPAIDEVLLDGLPFAEDEPQGIDRCHGSCEPHVLGVRAAAGSAETWVDAGQTRTEDLVTSWLATSGDFAAPFGLGPDAEADWTAPDAEGTVLFWFALRDDRGGVVWAARQALVR